MSMALFSSTFSVLCLGPVFALQQGPDVALPSATLAEPLAIVPLSKQYVPIQRNNITVSYKTAYFGKVYVGLPAQEFTVVFDTGSAHLILPSLACTSESCKNHHRYDLHRSTTAKEVRDENDQGSSGDHVQISFGTGEVMGNFVEESVCLGPQNEGMFDLDEIDHTKADLGEHGTDHMSVLQTTSKLKVDEDALFDLDELDDSTSLVQESKVSDPTHSCVSVRIVLAKNMTHEPFHAFEFDGVLGLGLESLALQPEFSFFGQMTRSRGQDRHLFGLFLSKSDDITSEISFGGIDARRTASALQWAAVANANLGYWQINVHGVRVGNKTLDLCEDGCAAILDSGTSLFGVPEQSLKELHWLLAREASGDDKDLDCRQYPGPEMVFDLGGFELTLGPEEYTRENAMRLHKSSENTTQVFCRAALLKVAEMPPLSSRTFIFGEPLLRKYYTAYDWANQRVGFAPALQPAPTGKPPSHSIFGKPSKPAPTEITV